MNPGIDIKLATVVVTALVDSVNPCAIGVMLLLVTYLARLRSQKKRMILVGSIYIAAVYIAYFLIGIGLLMFLQKFGLAEPVGIFVGILIIGAGILEIKDFFWYGQGFSLTIPARYVAPIKKYARKGTIPAVIALGFLVAAVELPCTGGPYLAITAILAKDFQWVALWYLLLYNLIFVMPLIVILVLSYFGASVPKMKAWKMKYRKWMRLAIGIVLIALGVLLILYSRGYITLGY